MLLSGSKSSSENGCREPETTSLMDVVGETDFHVSCDDHTSCGQIDPKLPRPFPCTQLGYHNVQFASIAGYWFPVPDDQSAVLNNSEPQVNMAPKEYAHIRVSKELQGVLKCEADRTGISISDYIAPLLRRNQAIGTLMAGESYGNIPTEAKRDADKHLNRKRRTDPAGFEPATPGLEGRCYIHAKPRAQCSLTSG